MRKAMVQDSKNRRQTRGSKMSEDDKRDRKFEYALTKAQVDFEFWFAFSIGMFAIGYGLLSSYKDSLWGMGLTDVLITLAGAFLIRAYYLKEQRFKDIRKKYIDG
jgi:hypothetical protein